MILCKKCEACRYAEAAGDDELANAARHAGHVCTYPCEPCCEKDPEYSMELHATQPKKDWPTVKAEAKLREWHLPE